MTYVGTENSYLPSWKSPVCHYTLGKKAREYIIQELVMRKSYAKVDEVALVPVVHIVASVHVVPIVAALYIPIVAHPSP